MSFWQMLSHGFTVKLALDCLSNLDRSGRTKSSEYAIGRATVRKCVQRQLEVTYVVEEGILIGPTAPAIGGR